MADTYEEAMARATNQNGVGRLVERLAEEVGNRATSQVVFGDPVEREGVTVIPVAKVRWGIGGGAGAGADEQQHHKGEGEGGGAGLMATPVGYIELSGGEAHFRRIVDPAAMWPVLLAGGVAAWLVLRGLKALLRSR